MYCLQCGLALAEREIDGIPRQGCSCGWVHWGNPIPAVGGVVVRDDEVLLCRRARPPKKGEWDLPGGFLEAGESAEAGLARELAEELAVAARIESYLGSGEGEYGGRPTMNLLFRASFDGEPKASDDVAQLRWWPLGELPPMAWPHEEACVRRLASVA